MQALRQQAPIIQPGHLDLFPADDLHDPERASGH
jgi:hypothetical protein